jgi:hypothetical protein
MGFWVLVIICIVISFSSFVQQLEEFEFDLLKIFSLLFFAF